MSRSVAREIAMKLVYSRLMGGVDTPDDVRLQSGLDEPMDSDETEYAASVAEGVFTNAPSIDALIGRHATGWSVERIARVDLAILRVALYEMLYREDVPTGASINEAVELAKVFGGDKSYAFINGILGTVAREMDGGVLVDGNTDGVVLQDAAPDGAESAPEG